MSGKELEGVFNQWRGALNGGDLVAFYDFMDEDMVIFDEDIPWRFSKADFTDHIAFHGEMWESFQWVARELQFQTRGSCGIVSGYATFRGKPKDAGFRQRFMGFTQTWLKRGGSWSMICWHQGPLNGQIDGASPG